jgi:CheY-like chemotaxis protein
MHAPKNPFAVRLLGFAPAERAQIETVLARAPFAGPSYFCLHDDSLQEPDLFIANGDDEAALAWLRSARPGALQPAALVGGSGVAGLPRLARPLNAFQLYEVLVELLEERARTLALLTARGQPFLPERRRHPRLGLDLGDEAFYASQRQPPPSGAVLIIDKGGAFRDHVARVVGTHKLAIEWTDSGRTAVRLCDETPVSLVMVNTSTPGIEPYSLCSSIKAQDGAARTAVIFLVSPAFHYDSTRARDAGVRGLLDKPVADRHLVAALQKLLSLPA